MELYRDNCQNENQEEIWMNIPGYEGYYQASNFGRIRSLQRKITQKSHKNYYMRFFKGKILQPRKQNSNYYLVWLSKDGVPSAQLVHRLVALTFIPAVTNKPCINHKNGIKTDNRIENLEWCSYSENIAHSHTIIGRKKTSKPIICIELNKIYQSRIEASKEIGIGKGAISHALNGRNKTAGGYTWKYA
jgi:hypothetical protein